MKIRKIMPAAATIALSLIAFAAEGKTSGLQAKLNGAQLEQVCNFTAGQKGKTVSWIITPGAAVSLLADDGSRLVLTGSGSFERSGKSGKGREVDGGGSWQTLDANNRRMGSGTFQVTGFVKLNKKDAAPPVAATIVGDQIGTQTGDRAGLAFLKLAYSDGTEGVLAIAAVRAETQKAAFVGAAVSKGAVDYMQRSACNPPSLVEFPAPR